MKRELLSFNVYDTNLNINDLIQRNRGELYADDYSALLRPDAFERMRLSLVERIDTCDEYDLYWLGVAESKRGNFDQAATYFSRSIHAGLTSIHAYGNLINCLSSIYGLDYQEVIRKISVDRPPSATAVESFPVRLRRQLIPLQVRQRLVQWMRRNEPVQAG